MENPKQLYTMKARHKDTGHIETLYGYVTANVIDDFWRAYIGPDVDVIIEQYEPNPLLDEL